MVVELKSSIYINIAKTYLHNKSVCRANTYKHHECTDRTTYVKRTNFWNTEDEAKAIRTKADQHASGYLALCLLQLQNTVLNQGVRGHCFCDLPTDKVAAVAFVS